MSNMEKLELEDLDVWVDKSELINDNIEDDDIEEDENEEILISKVPTVETHWYDNKVYNDGLHYTPLRALKNDFDYCFTNGGRSNGKTSGWQMQMIDDFFNFGYCYGKIVRKYEFDPRQAVQWFSDVVVKYAKEVWHHELVADRTSFYLIPEEGEPDRYLPLEKGQRVKRLNMKMFCTQFNFRW